MKYEIPFYTKAAGATTITVQTDKGLTLATLTDQSEAGLNFVNWNLAVEPGAKAEYEKYLNETKKKDDKEITLEAAEDKNIYVRPGKYKVVVATAGGAKAEQTLTIKAPEKRPSRRGTTTFAIPSTPGEWEEYMEEELGVEEVK